MKEHPILFNGEMVRAILNGRKTQTRRVLKPQPLESARNPPYAPYDPGMTYVCPDYFPTTAVQKSVLAFCESRGICHCLGTKDYAAKHCPYGQPGDRLWVRETFSLSPDGPIYRATQEDAGILSPGDRILWTPSIFMRRHLCRILLEITEVRVQRVQEITVHDAIDEGIDAYGGDDEHRNRSTVENYHLLWDSINAKRGYGWAANPWVWALSFKKLP